MLPIGLETRLGRKRKMWDGGKVPPLTSPHPRTQRTGENMAQVQTAPSKSGRVRAPGGVVQQQNH